MLTIDPQRALFRFKQAKNELGQRAPDGYLLGHLDTKPLDSSYPRSQIFFGSHFDQNPNTEDRIEIWNSRPEPGKGELLHQEIFVQRTERRGWTFTKTPVLHCYHVMMHTGGAIAALALVSIDLNTGQPFRQEEGEQASRTIRKQGLWEQRPVQHDRSSMEGWKPEPLPAEADPDWQAQTREEVTRMAEALQGESGGVVRMDGNGVVVGGVRVPRRS